MTEEEVWTLFHLDSNKCLRSDAKIFKVFEENGRLSG